jgi:hypothetical protein
MRKTWIGAAVALAWLGACTTQATPTSTLAPTPARPTSTPPPTATLVLTPTEQGSLPGQQPGLPLPAERGEFFSASGACSACHTDLTDDSGADVSLDTAWRSTSMGNSSRDPYWQASVRAEVLRLPDRQPVIEDTCATCHMPMARFTSAAGGGTGTILGDGYLDPDNPLHDLAMDGVSCTLCHQIRETNLGPESYNGNFSIDTELPQGQRPIFGPYSTDETLAAIMQSVSGYVPAQAVAWGQGLHLAQSELCATCHTLYTPFVDIAGQPAEFPEQVPYLEWFYSDYRGTATCQECHMPSAEGGVRISSASTTPRSPFSQHLFVGGNVFMLDVLRTFGEELGVTASGSQFEATIAQTLNQLQTETASIAFGEIHASGSRLTAEVSIESQVGHKFPTSFPSRRAWIHFLVQDASGQTVFESGAVNPDGSIVGNGNDADPTDFEPHYQAIVSPDQVQIYEAILGTTSRQVTTSLFGAATYLKDNRLLPSGFEKSAPYTDIAVRGGAFDDPDFVGGGDHILYSIDLGSAQAPFTVTVELLYQSVGYRWAQNLALFQSDEISRFLGYYADVPNVPVVISSQTVEVGE